MCEQSELTTAGEGVLEVRKARGQAIYAILNLFQNLVFRCTDAKRQRCEASIEKLFPLLGEGLRERVLLEDRKLRRYDGRPLTVNNPFLPLLGKDKRMGNNQYPPQPSLIREGATHVAHSHNIRRAAFTLAEALITLGIIGVVAALTMPVLISNYRKQVTETKLKQTYSILSNATSKLIAETGIPFSSYYVITMHNDVCPSTATHLEECADSLYEDVIKSNNIKVINEYDHSYPLWYSSLINNVINDEGAIAAVYHGKWFTLPNGCSVGIYNGSFSVITDNLSRNQKVKLVGGKNYFQFQPANIDNQNTIKEILPGLAPMTQTERKRYNTRADLINACKSNELGGVVNIACSQLFIEDGLRFSDDYPIKF